MRLLTCTFEFNGDASLLNNAAAVERSLQEITKLAGFTICKQQSHIFTPIGVSMTMILSESHIAAHTWPEKNFAYIALTSCKAVATSFYDEATVAIKSCFASTSVTYEAL